MSFRELYGQPGLRYALTGKLAKGAVSHATLISGLPGSGKKSWGLALARALLCSRRQGAASCGECWSCRQFQLSGPPTFFHLKPQGRRLGIEQIRCLQGKVYLEGDNRVCLIEESDKMTAEACGALLKILEEPPPGLYFILLAGRPQQLPITILSRCQCFTLHPLSGVEITRLLMEKKDLSADRARLLARLSKGLPGLALGLAEDETFEKRRAEAVEIAFKLAQEDCPPLEILDFANGMAGREDLLDFLELIYLVYRDGLLFLLCGDDSLLIDPAPARHWNGKISPLSLEEAMGLIRETVQQLSGTNVNRRLALEGMLLQLRRRFALCRK